MTRVFTSPAKRPERHAIEVCPNLLPPTRPQVPYGPDQRAACEPPRP
ncbi:hypothetical protein OO014_14450 [Intrasporangium calvum]|uniref:Uncharacterized protein n=1 Tax=Intrasporangium calvum TaxID=53358 RepID=A0ABT5GJN7_9MICO|nr:hypothetical protein [Intrasporangium calvum]MDC5698457.1 hypothetical protein [Intrasporangium calvum]